MIDEKKLIEKIEKMVIPLSTPDGSESIDIGINGYNECLVDVLGTIKEQPKVGEWIPVEERLPNEEEFEKNYCRNHWGAEFIVMIKGANRPTSLYYKEGVWFDDDNNDYDVIAWQPLPEPFKGDIVEGNYQYINQEGKLLRAKKHKKYKKKCDK